MDNQVPTSTEELQRMVLTMQGEKAQLQASLEQSYAVQNNLRQEASDAQQAASYYEGRADGQYQETRREMSAYRSEANNLIIDLKLLREYHHLQLTLAQHMLTYARRAADEVVQHMKNNTAVMSPEIIGLMDKLEKELQRTDS